MEMAEIEAKRYMERAQSRAKAKREITAKTSEVIERLDAITGAELPDSEEDEAWDNYGELPYPVECGRGHSTSEATMDEFHGNIEVASREMGILPVAMHQVKHTDYETLEAPGYMLGRDNATTLFRAMKDLSGLVNVKTLNLSQNQLSCDSFEEFLSAMSTQVHLENVNLSDNNIGKDNGRVISERLPLWTKLKSLDLSGCRLYDLAGSAILLSLAAKKTVKKPRAASNIEVLKLARNRIGSRKSVEALCKVLSTCPCLEELDVSYNKIANPQSALIGSCLSRNVKKLPLKLRRLNISWNALSNEGAFTMSNYLDKSDCLMEDLDLRSNNIYARGAVTILSSGAMREGLKRLAIDHNPIGEYGGREVIRIMQARDFPGLSFNECNVQAPDLAPTILGNRMRTFIVEEAARKKRAAAAAKEKAKAEGKSKGKKEPGEKKNTS